MSIDTVRLDNLVRKFLLERLTEPEAVPLHHVLMAELMDAGTVVRVKVLDEASAGSDALLVVQGQSVSMVEVTETKTLIGTQFPAVTGVTLRTVREIDHGRDRVVEVGWTLEHPLFPGRLEIDARSLRPNEQADVGEALRRLVTD